MNTHTLLDLSHLSVQVAAKSMGGALLPVAAVDHPAAEDLLHFQQNLAEEHQLLLRLSPQGQHQALFTRSTQLNNNDFNINVDHEGGLPYCQLGSVTVLLVWEMRVFTWRCRVTLERDRKRQIVTFMSPAYADVYYLQYIFSVHVYTFLTFNITLYSPSSGVCSLFDC